MGADWRDWQHMALDSQGAAELLWSAGRLRTCTSRAYYAAYQAVTAVLIYRGLPPPLDREAWSHAETPGLIVEHWTPLRPSQDQRRDLARRLGELYKLRLDADYVGSHSISPWAVQNAIKDANFLIKVVNSLLPEE